MIETLYDCYTNHSLVQTTQEQQSTTGGTNVRGLPPCSSPLPPPQNIDL